MNKIQLPVTGWVATVLHTDRGITCGVEISQLWTRCRLYVYWLQPGGVVIALSRDTVISGEWDMK